LASPQPSPREREPNLFKVLSFGEDLGEADFSINILTKLNKKHQSNERDINYKQ
jgi:hypothetical protein